MFLSFFRSKKSKLQATQKAEQELREGFDLLQRELGDRAFEAIKKAASENVVHRVAYRSAGPMVSSRMPNNGGRYSVFVHMSGMNGMSGLREDDLYLGIDFTIDARRKLISTLLGPYGPDEHDTLENFEAALERACDYVRNRRLYKSVAA